jgi:hypothetical protein
VIVHSGRWCVRSSALIPVVGKQPQSQPVFSAARSCARADSNPRQKTRFAAYGVTAKPSGERRESSTAGALSRGFSAFTFGIAALIAVVIMFAVSLAPHRTELTIEVLFTLTMLGIVLFFLFAIVGFPLWFFLNWCNGWSFPRWVLWPCGALTVFIWLVFSLLKPTTPRATQ